MVGVFLYAQNDTTYIYKGNSVNEDSLLLYFDGTNVYSGDSHNVIESNYSSRHRWNSIFSKKYTGKWNVCILICYEYEKDNLYRYTISVFY